ncbi:DUF397 domain-containing protein [Streptomyces sp. CA-181903]|uniref:DUF397 domain-containing protein n=1 Tax=Streptomyces sp. CA-181903 TaxID=3240055 RepID=UPI003D94F7C6
MSEAKWQKSSFSNDRDECIELARKVPGEVLIRESDVPDVTIKASRAQLRTFISGVKAGWSSHPI